MMPTWLVSIFRRSAEVEIAKNYPVNSVRHGNVFKPLDEMSFLRVGAWCINISESPVGIMMHRNKLNR
jgi:hypothetical protein